MRMIKIRNGPLPEIRERVVSHPDAGVAAQMVVSQIAEMTTQALQWWYRRQQRRRELKLLCDREFAEYRRRQ
ncbi:MAG TPA: hypothetical protein VHU15_06755 [Stellaceae bacterium]|nr:hypothetical protein [Stellaceae bacterium]